MIKYIYIILFFLLPAGLIAQSGNQSIVEGSITFISSQNVYVKFDNTDGISVGDTLFINHNKISSPAIVVQHLSSKSVAGAPLSNLKMGVGDNISAIIYEDISTGEGSKSLPVVAEVPLIQSQIKSEKKQISKKPFSGRFSVNSYTNISNVSGWESQRWRYRLSLNELEIADPSLRFDSYITFSYKAGSWDLVQQDLNNALRIYNFSLTYTPTTDLEISVGRRINRTASNIGSYDGLDFQYRLGKHKIGVIVGSRPDWSDFSININLFQYGAFVSREDILKDSRMVNTLGVFEQKNNGSTDRRFLYYQHHNNYITNVNMYFSSEFDLYRKINGVEENSFNLTSLYFNVRYAPVKKVRITASYDSRKNIIYYETFKSYADSLLDSETRHGFRIRLNLRPINRIITGISYGYNDRGESIQPSTNYNIFLTYTRIPFIYGSLSANYTRLNTNYINGEIFGFRFYHDLISGLSNISLGYRRIFYQYTSTKFELNQEIFSAGIYFNLMRSLSLSLSYEGIFESERRNSLLFASLNIRF